jgi:hypothetical protein
LNVKEYKKVGVFYSQALGENVELETTLLHPFLKGQEIRRYFIEPAQCSILFPYSTEDGVVRLIAESSMKQNYPRTWEYLSMNKSLLQNREGGRWKGPLWYAYGRNQNLDMVGVPRLLTRDIVETTAFAPDPTGKYVFVSGYGITYKNTPIHPSYFLALLNSKLLDFVFRKISTPLRGGFYRTFPQFIGQFPIHLIRFNKKEERKLHNELVELAEVMLDLKKREQKATGRDRELLARHIEKTNHEIDDRVYYLYKITTKERRIIEND